MCTEYSQLGISCCFCISLLLWYSKIQILVQIFLALYTCGCQICLTFVEVVVVSLECNIPFGLRRSELHDRNFTALHYILQNAERLHQVKKLSGDSNFMLKCHLLVQISSEVRVVLIVTDRWRFHWPVSVKQLLFLLALFDTNSCHLQTNTELAGAFFNIVEIMGRTAL